MNIELIIFIIYLALLIGIGLFFYARTTSIEGFLLGDRGLGSWVTAISAQASDMSGWLLMGLPGAIYLGGIAEIWIGIGLFLGTLANWLITASRLRAYTEKADALTLSTFFERRFKDPTKALRLISAIIILVFFTTYASSGLVASGKLFQLMFGWDYTVAIIVGTLVIMVYTFLGGFLAVSYTDLIQGMLMIVAIVAVPLLAYSSMGSLDVAIAMMKEQGLSTSLFGGGVTVLGTISAVAWGLGYFGQPHILARFMGIKSIKQIPKARVIAITWVGVALFGAVAVAVLAIPLYPGLSGGAEETVFMLMIREFFPPWIAGFFLAAIMAAIMSTIDSQLLVCSSALTEDIYALFTKKEPTEKQVVLFGRLAVIGVAGVALLLAISPDSTVMGLVSYSWAGFGAAFGPLVLFGLYSKSTSWQAALAGMLVGALTVIVWKNVGLSAYLYEIVPGFVFNVVTMLIVGRFTKVDPAIEAEFEAMVLEVKA